MAAVKIDPSWQKALAEEFEKLYFEQLTITVKDQYTTNEVFPPAKQIFRAFDLCPFDKVKVVIVGQDPYHGKDQANGLSFAVNDGIPLPPSLKNIFQEIENDLGLTPTNSGDLTRWANQGVLLLNSVLTVAAHKPASHAGIGWEDFTDSVIQALNEKREHIVYMLWGKYAQEKGQSINKEKNLVLTSAHPSPFSAQNFFNNHHFSKCNNYLKNHNLKPIDWS